MSRPSDRRHDGVVNFERRRPAPPRVSDQLVQQQESQQCKTWVLLNRWKTKSLMSQPGPLAALLCRYAP